MRVSSRNAGLFLAFVSSCVGLAPQPVVASPASIIFDMPSCQGDTAVGYSNLTDAEIDAYEPESPVVLALLQKLGSSNPRSLRQAVLAHLANRRAHHVPDAEVIDVVRAEHSGCHQRERELSVGKAAAATVHKLIQLDDDTLAAVTIAYGDVFTAVLVKGKISRSEYNRAIFGFEDYAPPYGAQVVKDAPSPARSSGRYSVTSCGAVLDSKTGMAWKLGPDKNTTWDEARTWVSSLATCNGSGWRMPTTTELATLYNPSASSGIGFAHGGSRYPAHISSLLSPIGDGSWGWSGDSRGDTARSFNLNQGVVTQYDKASSLYTTRAFAIQSH